MAKGDFIEYVVSDNPNKYPDNGEQGGYYWECVGKPIISFTINGTSFQAEEGMTWNQWCSSDYNTGGYYAGVGDSNSVGTSIDTVIYSVTVDDVITPDFAYTIVSGGTGK